MQPGAKVVPIKAKNSMKAGDRAKLARLPAPVHQVQEKGKQCLLKSLRSLFDNADDALFELADKATNNQDQNLYFDSMREVRIRRRQMEAQFADEIDNAFMALINEAAPSTEEYFDSVDISEDGLSLVEHDELEELVAVDSMVSKSNEFCGESLQYLSLRIDSLVPQKVYQKNNPVGPAVVCESFVKTTQQLDADIKAKLVLFKLFDKYVVSELHTVYETLNTLLIEQNILPSLKHSRPHQNSGRPNGQGQGNPVHAVPGNYQNGNQQGGNGYQQGPAHQGNVQQGGGQLGSSHQGGTSYGNAGGGMPQGQVPVGQSNGAVGNHSGTQANAATQGSTGQGGAGQVVNGFLANDELLGALSQLQTQQTNTWGSNPQVTSISSLQTDVGALLSQVIQNQYGPRKVGELESDVMNLVKMLFDYILDDRNLAEPMKALIGRLQIPILKVAIVDKSFFNKGGHPARRLLNEMATACLGWQEDAKNEEGIPSDALYQKINNIVHTLLSEFETDVSIFSEILADFVSFIDKERKRASILEQRTIDAEDGKAKAESARHQVNAALQEKIDGKELPAEIQKILDEAWSNVLFLICLRDGPKSDSWQRALQTAEDLVWSATVTLDQPGRQKLLGMIPDLVKRIRAGLEKISYNPFDLTQLLNQLEKLHMHRLQVAKNAAVDSMEAKRSASETSKADVAEVKTEAKTAATKTPVTDASKTSEAPTSAAKVESSIKPASDKLEQKPKAAISAAPVAPKATNLSKPNTSAAIANIDESYFALVSKLTQGTWFEMSENGGKNFRCRLAAIIKATGVYIFVNRNGMKVAEKSKESLALAMKDGNLRLLDDTMLFDRALESVIGNLRASRKPS